MARRRSGLAAVALVLAGFAALIEFAPSANAAAPWSITASPLILTAGVPTQVTLTVHPAGRNIACLKISISTGFTVLSASVATAPGTSWAGFVGGPPTVVTFATTNGPDRLNTAAGVFDIQVIATTGPLPAWTARAYGEGACADSRGAPLLPLSAFVILPGATPTPTPKPTPTPTPKPTPTRTPSPSPSVRPSPSLGPSPSPVPTATLPGTSPRPSAGASPSDSPGPSSAVPSPSGSTSPLQGGGTISQTGSGGSPAGGGGGLQVQPLQAGDTVQLHDFGALSTTAMVAWLVPGALLTLPSLLIVLIVLAQAGFASAFVPVTRRVLGGGSRRRRRDQPGTPA